MAGGSGLALKARGVSCPLGRLQGAGVHQARSPQRVQQLPPHPWPGYGQKQACGVVRTRGIERAWSKQVLLLEDGLVYSHGFGLATERCGQGSTSRWFCVLPPVNIPPEHYIWLPAYQKWQT